MSVQPVLKSPTFTSTSSILWIFLGRRVARARTDDFLATTAVFRARPDLVRLTEKKQENNYNAPSGRDAVSSKWRSRKLGSRAGRHVLGNERFLGNDLTIEIIDTFLGVSLFTWFGLCDLGLVTAA